MRKPLIVGINASPFTDGNTANILAATLLAAEETGARAKIMHLGDIPHDDGRRDESRYELYKRVDMLPTRGGLRTIVRTILKAEGIIFATPTRNFTASSRMLALLSWLQVTTDAHEYELAGKVGAFMSVFEECGGQSANEAMFSPSNHMGLAIPPFCSFFFDKKKDRVSEGSWMETDKTLVGLNVRRLCQILRGELVPPPGGFTAKMWNDSRIGSW